MTGRRRKTVAMTQAMRKFSILQAVRTSQSNAHPAQDAKKDGMYSLLLTAEDPNTFLLLPK